MSDDRRRALAHVRALYLRYARGVRSGRLPHNIDVFYRNRARALGHDIEEMRAEGEGGDVIAGGWCRVGGA